MTQISLFQAQDEGLRRRDEGIAKVTANQEPSWQDAGLDLIRRLAATGAEFSSDALPEGFRAKATHPNAIGALFAVAQRDRIIARVGWTKSTRPEAHSRVIPTYRRAGL